MALNERALEGLFIDNIVKGQLRRRGQFYIISGSEANKAISHIFRYLFQVD
jgi:hypothetical protein